MISCGSKMRKNGIKMTPRNPGKMVGWTVWSTETHEEERSWQSKEFSQRHIKG